MMTDKKCRIDIVADPTYGIKIVSTGDRASCDEKRAKVTQHTGPYLDKFINKRWEHVDPPTTTPSPIKKTQPHANPRNLHSSLR